MSVLGGGPLSDLPIAGAAAAAGGTDNISLTAIAESNAVIELSVTATEVVSLPALTEANALAELTVSTVLQNPQPFIFPVEYGFQTEAIVGPGWLLHFINVDTGLPAHIMADSASAAEHANPIKIDRRGAIPGIYLNSALQYQFVLQNEHGVEKYETYYTWPNTLEKHISLTTLAETNTLVELSTSEP